MAPRDREDDDDDTFRTYRRLLMSKVEELTTGISEIRDVQQEQGQNIALIRAELERIHLQEVAFRGDLEKLTQVAMSLANSLTEVKTNCQYHRKQTEELEVTVFGKEDKPGLRARFERIELYGKIASGAVVLVLTTWGAAIASGLWKMVRVIKGN